MRFMKNISLWLLLVTLSFSTPVFSQEIFHNIISQQSSSVVYDTDYQAVLTQATSLGYTLPDASNRTTQNQMVVDLKAAGIWTKLDVFYPMLTNIDFATLNWKAPTLFQLTLVNSPTYNTSTGFQGNGTTSYLSTNWAPNDGVQFTRNDAGMGGLNTNDLNSASALFGSLGASAAAGAYLQPRSTNSLFARLNQNTSTSVANAASNGRYHIKRTGATATNWYKNGSSLITGSVASTAVNALDVAILAINNDGVITSLSTRQIRYFWAGASLNGLEATFDGILATYYP